MRLRAISVIVTARSGTMTRIAAAECEPDHTCRFQHMFVTNDPRFSCAKGIITLTRPDGRTACLRVVGQALDRAADSAGRGQVALVVVALKPPHSRIASVPLNAICSSDDVHVS